MAGSATQERGSATDAVPESSGSRERQEYVVSTPDRGHRPTRAESGFGPGRRRHALRPGWTTSRRCMDPGGHAPATVEFLDTPGLMAGSHADNPQRPGPDPRRRRPADRPGGSPAATRRPSSRFREEMLFADLGVVTNRAERLEASVKKPRPDRELPSRNSSRQARAGDARRGREVATLGLSAEDKKPLRSFGLLTDKPQVAVLNAAQGQVVPDSLLAMAPEPSQSTRSSNSSSPSSNPRNAPCSWPTWE